ncbi:MAG: hypothetical protein FGM24_08970 [Candidatus Kapabacteria bacterium]|nr:hypothetical protein [Candidatus Kapabacteria bacterium]
MMSSARILAQRYLEGDMTDVERAAFLNDVSNDPRLAQLLEQEATLDLAIIDDAYSIEAPAHIRDAVLSAVSASSTSVNTSRIGINAAVGTICVVMGLMLGVTNISVTSPDPVVTAVRQQVSPTQQTPKPNGTQSSRSNGVAPTTVSAGTVVSDNIQSDDREAANPQVIPAINSVAVRNASALLQRPAHDPFAPASAVSSAYRTDVPWASNLSAGIAPSLLSLRYNLFHDAAVQLFVEVGSQQLSRTTTAYNGSTPTMATISQHVPFAVIGMQGAVMNLRLLDRPIIGSASVGVTSAGPIAMADLAIDVTRIGSIALGAGVRLTATMDLRSGTTMSANAMPLLQMRVALP